MSNECTMGGCHRPRKKGARLCRVCKGNAYHNDRTERYGTLKVRYPVK